MYWYYNLGGVSTALDSCFRRNNEMKRRIINIIQPKFTIFVVIAIVLTDLVWYDIGTQTHLKGLRLMLAELASWVVIKVIGALGAGALGLWVLNKLEKFTVWRVTHKIPVSLKVDGERKGRVERVDMKPHGLKWFCSQFGLLLTSRPGGFVGTGKFFFGSRYGFWHGLLGIRGRYKDRCRCVPPKVSVPEWAVLFDESDNRELWIRDDVVAMRHQVNCRKCRKLVFVSRADVISMAEDLYDY